MKLGGSLISSSAAKSAANTQAAAADRAAEAQLTAARESNQLQKDIFDKQVSLQEPFRQAGMTGQNRLMELLGLGGNTGAQGYGSALTYARRYSLMAACGIAPEDDDGNAASNKSKPPDVAHSGPAIAFSQLSPDWQAWITDLAREVENAFESSGPAAAQELIDNNREQMEAEHVAALWSRLDSKTRSSIKATKRAA